MGYMIKGMTPIIETTNSILKAALKKESFEPAKNLRKTSDGLRMLSALCTLLNQYGKDNFKPIMKESFKKITHTNNSVTEKLFGDDLQRKIEQKGEGRKTIQTQLGNNNDQQQVSESRQSSCL